MDRLISHRPPFQEDARAERDYTERALEGDGALEMSGRPSRFTCPDCGGSLWDGGPEEPTKFRCRVGHSWTLLGLLERQTAALEQALWTALRALSERADLARRMRDAAADRRHEYGRRLFDRQLEEYEARAELIREVLRSPDPLTAISEEQLARAVLAHEGTDETGTLSS
jgi:two-component system chemotaxis response regulator CheB